MAGSAMGEGGRGSCRGGGVPPALHAQQSAWGPGQTDQPSERSGWCMDGAHTDWQEPGCGRGGLSKAATAGSRAETRWSPSRPPARLSRQLSHCGSFMPSGTTSRTFGSQAGCEHSGGEGANGGERSLSAPLWVPLPQAPSSGGRAGADWTTCRPRPQRTRQGATCLLACSCGDSLSRETATSGGAGAAGPCVSPRVGPRPSVWGAWPREGGCSVRGGGGTWRTLPSALLRGAGSGSHSQGHKGPITPTELPSVVAQEHSPLGLCSRGLTGRGGAPPGSRSWPG